MAMRELHDGTVICNFPPLHREHIATVLSLMSHRLVLLPPWWGKGAR